MNACKTAAVPALLALAAGCAPAPPASAPGVPAGEPFAVYSAATGRAMDMAELADSLAGADVVLFGERHDDAATHIAERRLLEALARRGADVVVGMEMFERDVQPALDAYLGGRMPEAEFVEASRAWPNYSTDYRPLVEAARAAGWAVAATNVPRSLAASVAARGLAALDRLDPFHRGFAAAEIECPEDEYYRLFADAMGGHPGTGEGGPGSVGRLYEAQCVKDETMAESILRARAPGTTVVHFNGGFHSDRRLGIAPRLLRRDPRLRVVVVSTLPAGAPRPAGLADFVVRTPRTPNR